MQNYLTDEAVVVELTRLDRVVLHLRCLVRDHKYRWHLAGIWREVTQR